MNKNHSHWSKTVLHWRDVRQPVSLKSLGNRRCGWPVHALVWLPTRFAKIWSQDWTAPDSAGKHKTGNQNLSGQKLLIWTSSQVNVGSLSGWKISLLVRESFYPVCLNPFFLSALFKQALSPITYRYTELWTLRRIPLRRSLETLHSALCAGLFWALFPFPSFCSGIHVSWSSVSLTWADAKNH